MAPGRKRGAKGVRTKSELKLGDLVLAKVKGFPAWPAKISRPEDWERMPDPKKYFVQFFGTSEMNKSVKLVPQSCCPAFVASADIQVFTNDAKNKLSARCKGKTVRYFSQAVKEICEEFEELQRKNLSGVRDDNCTQTLASEVHSLDPVVDEAVEVSENKEIDGKGPRCELESKGSSHLGYGLEPCLQRQGDVEFQDVKPCLPDDVDHSLSLHVSLGNKSKLSPNYTNLVKDSVAVSGPSHNSLLKEEGSHVIKVEGMFSHNEQNELSNGHKPKLKTVPKKKPEGAMRRNSGPTVPREHTGEMLQRKCSGGSMKVSSAGISRSSLDVGSERKERKLLKGKRHSKTADDGREDAEVNFEEHNGATSRRRMKAQLGHEKQRFQTTEASCPAKISKSADTGDDVKSQTSKKSDSRSPNDVDDKKNSTESKRLTSGGKAENRRPLRLETSTYESNHSTDEDDLPPTKRHRRASKAVSSSALISENRLGTSVLRKNDLMLPNKVRSPVMLLPTKRRAVRLCDDEDDELPKTPIHGGFSNKEQSDRVSKKASSPATQQGPEKRTRELSDAHASPSLSKLHSEKLPSIKAKPVLVSPIRSPKSISGTTPSAELQNKHSSKTTGNISQKKNPAGDKKSASASDRSISFLNQSLSDITKSASYGEKRKTTPNSDLRISDSALLVGTSNETFFERLDVGKDEKTSFQFDSKISDSVMSMKHLIAAAQERKRQTHLQNSYGNPLLSLAEAVPGRSPSPIPAALAYVSSNMLQLDVQGLHPTSPCSNVHQFSSSNHHENEELEERRVSSGHQGSGSFLSGGTEAAVARDAFEGMIETLSRTKESIGRATRLAIDCAKYGIANEVDSLTASSIPYLLCKSAPLDVFLNIKFRSDITKIQLVKLEHKQLESWKIVKLPVQNWALSCLVYTPKPCEVPPSCPNLGRKNGSRAIVVVELLVQKLENEPSLHRRVDLFFLVDSITQCSHSQRGIPGASYIPIVQQALPRLIGAAAASGVGAQENRRQCHKVLRLWLERKILPDSVLRRHIDDMGVVNDDTCVGFSLRRPSRAERAIDDPIREVEGMVVDEYGSNAMFQLPGLLSARVFEEEDEYEDNFPTNFCKKIDNTSPSNLSPTTSRDAENHTVTPSDRRHCILEDVDGELEMEDVSEHQKDERPLFANDTFELASLEPNSIESASNTSAEWLPSPDGSPPLPPGSPPQSIPPQPPLMSQHLPPLPSALSHSPQSAYKLPPVPHEISGARTGNQHTNMVFNTHRSHVDASVRSEVMSQQSSCFTPSGVSTAREHVGYNSSRHVEYGQGDAYMNPHASQQRQQFLPVQQHQYPPYSLPNFSDGSRRYTSDEQWRIQVNELNADCPRGGWIPGGRSCSGPPYPHEGYFGPPPERPPASAVNFQPSGPNNLASASQIPDQKCLLSIGDQRRVILRLPRGVSLCDDVISYASTYTELIKEGNFAICLSRE
ncbi:hypothetical protein DH2020_003908 [Rehmannia glutinosa]|uniref:HUA2-like protein n=1 Tax=Rehmannia glutinosa TaxID=99300 RepID=A0ABR0XN14_REHGL